jgi:nucleotide-binding universal stress UspA family protein
VQRIEPGSQVGEFILGERIHSGAMGHIYAAMPLYGTGPGFPVIVKVPTLGRGAATDMVGLETEIMLMPQLTGPHVPRYVASGAMATFPYVAMERIEGQSLMGIARRAPLAFGEAARLGAALADALHSLHSQGVVHHDVKPENVLVKDDGTAVLVDFGFARHERFPDLLGEEMQFAAGSAGYVSPEQLRDRRGDPRSDVYSLGAILYELATGEAPFGHPATLAGMRDRLWRAPVPPRARNASVPPWLQEVILRCLEADAGSRYQSAAHVAFDLRNAAEVELTARAHAIAAPGLLEQARRWWQSLGGTPKPRDPAATRAPVVMVAVDTSHPEDERHGAIRWTARQVLSLSTDYRVMFVSVVAAPAVREEAAGADTSSARHMRHLAILRQWIAPLGLAAHRASLHVVESPDPAGTLLALARQNHVDLIVLGAPAPDPMRIAWWRSVASAVTAAAPCSVHVVRAPRREAAAERAGQLTGSA